MLTLSPLTMASVLLATTFIKPIVGAPVAIVLDPTAGQAVESHFKEQAWKDFEEDMREQMQHPYISFKGPFIAKRVFTHHASGETGNGATSDANHHDSSGIGEDAHSQSTFEAAESSAEGQCLAKREFFNPDCGGPLGRDGEIWWQNQWCAFWGC